MPESAVAGTAPGEEPTGSGATRATRRLRSKAVLLSLIALSGALALVSATQTWVVISLSEGAAAFGWLTIAGQQLNSSLSPIAIAALAAVLALTIAGPAFRRVLGVLVALLGAGIVTLGLIALSGPRGESEWSIGEATGIVGGSQAELVRSVTVTAWPSVAVAAGAVMALAGVGVLLFGGRWRSGGRRYEASAGRRRPEADPSDAPRPAGESPGAADRDRISDWDTMSEGEDPTRTP